MHTCGDYCCCNKGYEANVNLACERCSAEQGDSYRCAAEHEMCECTGTVIFGRHTKWSNPQESNGEIACNNGVFEDPAVGQVKECICTPAQVTLTTRNPQVPVTTAAPQPVDPNTCNDNTKISGSNDWWWCGSNQYGCGDHCCCQAEYEPNPDGECRECAHPDDNNDHTDECNDNQAIGGSDSWWWCGNDQYTCGNHCCCDNGWQPDNDGNCHQCSNLEEALSLSPTHLQQSSIHDFKRHNSVLLIFAIIGGLSVASYFVGKLFFKKDYVTIPEPEV